MRRDVRRLVRARRPSGRSRSARCALSRPGAYGTRSDQRGAHDRNRTDDLLLTMEMLYRLSYVGLRRPRRPMTRQRWDCRREGASNFGRDADVGRRLERRKDALPQDVFSLENTPGERTSTAIYCATIRYVNGILGVRRQLRGRKATHFQIPGERHGSRRPREFATSCQVDRIRSALGCRGTDADRGANRESEPDNDRAPRTRRLGSARGPRWSGKRDSNPRPSAWKADALPLSYSRECLDI